MRAAPGAPEARLRWGGLPAALHGRLRRNKGLCGCRHGWAARRPQDGTAAQRQHCPRARQTPQLRCTHSEWHPQCQGADPLTAAPSTPAPSSRPALACTLPTSPYRRDRAPRMLRLPQGHCRVPSPPGSCAKVTGHAAGARPGSWHLRNSSPQLSWPLGCQWLPSTHITGTKHPMGDQEAPTETGPLCSPSTGAPGQARKTTRCQEGRKQSHGSSGGDRAPGPAPAQGDAAPTRAMLPAPGCLSRG